MGYEITKFNFQDDLASALFNAKFQEIETYLNNIKEELKNVKEKNTEIEKENQKLKEQLDNKVELKELPLLNGWEKESQAYYYKTIGNLVICSARIKKTVPAYTGEYVAQLPQGYRISHGGQWSGYATENAGSGASKCIGLFITTDGKIGIDTLGANNLKCLMFTISFMAVD